MRDDASAGAIRVGGPDDLPVITALFDEAIDWLVARGQSGQWGTQHAADRPETMQRFAALAAGGGLRIAEHAAVAEGAMVVGDAPDYVPACTRPELYLLLLLTARRHAGHGTGARLIQRAVDEASRAGCQQLRVDCWTGAPSLVA